MSQTDTLVVGGSGFIGSYLMKRIEADNLDLVIDQDIRNGIQKRYKTIVFLACDQRDERGAFDYNLEMMESLIDYKYRDQTKLIYISSAAVYYGGNFYSESKRLGEKYAESFNESDILRLSNVYGHGDGHGAPDRFMRGEKDITGDGEQIRDLVSVEQVVLAIEHSILYPSTQGPHHIYNVSSGVGTTVNQMFEMFGSGEPRYAAFADSGTSISILSPGEVL